MKIFISDGVLDCRCNREQTTNPYLRYICELVEALDVGFT